MLLKVSTNKIKTVDQQAQTKKKKKASLDKTSTRTSGWESAMERVFKIH